MANDEPNGSRETDATSRSITRKDFEAVIRRAAELSAAEGEDPHESLSEDEVIRIATELGLPARFVRQALFELPELPTERNRSDWFGPSVLTSSRVVPGQAADLLRRLEDYLTTREYLQTARRRADRAFFVPADDAISNLARGLLRPSRRYFLSRARRVVVSVRPIEEGRSHVQIALDLGEQRRNAATGAWIGGSIVGTIIGGGATLAVALADLPSGVSVVAHVAAFAAGFGATLTAALAAGRAAFRRAFEGARFELEGLLDRAEHGQSLEPPPAPWRKRLQQKLLGHG